ncbi:MAG: hypothetical protein ACTS77_02800 [Arsenophonus sp. NC-TX2-MAG3]
MVRNYFVFGKIVKGIKIIDRIKEVKTDRSGLL